MSLQLMKERITCSGITAREEMIRDGQLLLHEELEQDPSYSPTIYFSHYDIQKEKYVDSRLAKLRIYNRKYSSLNGNYQFFLTTHDNPLKIGEYLHDKKDDTYWLVYNSFNVNDIHYEGKLIQCNHLLRWQLANGNICERYTNVTTASKYDVGENETSTLILSSNNYTVLMGYCEEGFELEGKRVFIDRRPTNPIKVFKMTRNDDVLYNSGNMGSILSFIADKAEFDPVLDNQELRICNYYSPTLSEESPQEDFTAKISGGVTIRPGRAKTWAVSFFDKNGNEISDCIYKWNIISDFDIEQSFSSNKIQLKIEDEKYIGKSFYLNIEVDNKILSQIKITIIDLL